MHTRFHIGVEKVSNPLYEGDLYKATIDYCNPIMDSILLCEVSSNDEFPFYAMLNIVSFLNDMGAEGYVTGTYLVDDAEVSLGAVPLRNCKHPVPAHPEFLEAIDIDEEEFLGDIIWQKTINSDRDLNVTYRLAYERIPAEEAGQSHRVDVRNGIISPETLVWDVTCTCPGYTHRGYCKHVMREMNELRA